MTKPIVLVIAGFFISFFIFTTSSCNKDTDCKATIKCVDSLGHPLNGASVLLYATVKTPTSSVTYTADLKANGNTDATGQVNFTFKLPAIYDVYATYSAARTFTGLGIIKLEVGQSVETTVTLN